MLLFLTSKNQLMIKTLNQISIKRPINSSIFKITNKISFTNHFLRNSKEHKNKFQIFFFSKKLFSNDKMAEKEESKSEIDNIYLETESDYLSKKINDPKKYKLSQLTFNILKHLENNQETYKNLCEESVKLSYEISENKNNDYIKEELIRINKQINKFEKQNVHYNDFYNLIFEIYNTVHFLEEAQEIGDDELSKSAITDLDRLYKDLANYQEEVINFLIPNEKAEIDTIKLEIKSATGGLESTLFAEDLLQMYQRFCEKNYFKFFTESYVASESAAKRGCKNGVFKITGENIYNYFKYESGVHKVQRVPITEKNGRVHSSTCQIAILIDKEFEEVEIEESDLKIEFMRAGGAGGQHVNKTESAVRITHTPSGIVVQNQDEREQARNKAKAMKVLKEKLNKLKYEEFNKELGDDKKTQFGRGDLSEKIRTYNWPDSRVTGKFLLKIFLR